MATNSELALYLNYFGTTNKAMQKILNYFGDYGAFLASKDEELLVIKNIGPKSLERLRNLKRDFSPEKIQEIRDKLRQVSVGYISIFDESYPEELKVIEDPPIVLYYKGDLNLLSLDYKIAVVGSRKTTSYGKWACQSFTKELAKLGFTIVSGLAAGIDSIAHDSSIREGARTIGVLGCGIDVIYPKRNRGLYEAMIPQDLILSEYPPGTEPYAFRFPERNRIISGLSKGVVVIEAQEQSGSLITAHIALDQGKDVFALPGNINSLFSRGTNLLIKDGARPLLSIEDIIEELGSPSLLEKNKDSLDLSNEERSIVDILSEGPSHIDILVYRTRLPVDVLSYILTGMELKGIVDEIEGNVFSLS